MDRGGCQERTGFPGGWEPDRQHRGEKETNPMKCANHPLNDANAYCGQCGRALCTECKREVGGMSYCESCLAARLQSPLPPWGAVGSGPSPGLALGLGFIPGVGAIYN